MRTDSFAGDQSGMALVLTLLIVSFLAAMTVQLMATIDRQAAASAAQREQVRLDAMVLGGLNLAKAALLVDRQENDFASPQDAWGGFDPDRLKSLTGDVDLTLSVTDLSGRLQINPLADPAKETYRAVWLRFLLSGRFAIQDEEEAEALLDALGDWIDQDDDQRPRGAEEPYYKTLAQPYACRNGGMVAPEELLLVKGMTPAIVYGTQEREGILPYVTIMGEDGKINLNAAPLPVLQALSEEMTPELAQELIDFREDRQNREVLASADWYRKVAGFPASVDLGADLLTVAGSYFQVQARADLHQYSRTGVGVVQRKDQTLKVLRWETH
jgi:general secretion pathway protein K